LLSARGLPAGRQAEQPLAGIAKLLNCYVGNGNEFMETIKTIENKKLVWSNISNPGEKELEFLRSNFGFHELDLRECPPPIQRPKLIERNKYIFMILQFPVYNDKTKRIYATEVDFFISPDYIVTVNEGGRLDPLQDFFRECQTNERILTETFESNHVLLYTILDKLLLYCFPMLNHVGWDIDMVEKKLFKNFDRHMVKEILTVKRNIVNFRKTMQAHKNVLKKLAENAEKFRTPHTFETYFTELVQRTKEIWDLLENYKESINALYETHASIASFRLSNIMKTLTIFSVIVFPLTLLAAIFGMNTLGAMPFVDHPYGFWIIMGVMAVGTIAMFIFFKKRKWI